MVALGKTVMVIAWSVAGNSVVGQEIAGVRLAMVGSRIDGLSFLDSGLRVR